MAYKKLLQTGGQMKIFAAIMMALPISTVSAAASLKVYTNLAGQYSCEAATTAAKEDLSGQCIAANMKLENMDYNYCYQDGDDGGYVYYYSISATGECNNNGF